ncbi:hypothetical protein NPX13_g1838 [Xylaria arbuscula]|uniref:BTB domain-containing protein n=1 Tax=Xylaria arbuscula TaxID=114810 RepID=A0A9W8NLK3_9PEZI|nr:hypothetical protein NPX13_g1838 [Xylaria arbuscula]
MTMESVPRVTNSTTNCQSDEQLLVSGTFSDVTVKCRDQDWALHRNILSSRCRFFRKALQTDTFKESKEHVIELHDQDPDHVRWIIHFIYTGKLPKGFETLIRGQASEMIALVDLYTAADFFMLDRLCTHAIKILYDILYEHSKGLHAFISEKGKRKLGEYDDKAFLTGYINMVKTVYSFGSTSFLPVKDVLLSYPKLTNYVVLQDELLSQQLFTDPGLLEFARDNLKSMVTTPGVLAYNCKSCGGHLDDRGKCTSSRHLPAQDPLSERGQFKRVRLSVNGSYVAPRPPGLSSGNQPNLSGTQ